MKLLAIDTTAKAASVCLASEDGIIGEFFVNTALTHSQTLMPMLEQLLSSTGIRISGLDAIAVNAGPGSFTGVRIGVAAVKGLAFAENLPCIPVSTLESMANNCLGDDCIVCAAMDARCSQVYNALFRMKGGIAERLTPDRALSIAELKQELANYSEEVYLVGDGAEICQNAFSDMENIVLVPENIRFQHAYGTAKAAERMAEENKLCTSDELMPLYLRLPQAERLAKGL